MITEAHIIVSPLFCARYHSGYVKTKYCTDTGEIKLIWDDFTQGETRARSGFIWNWKGWNLEARSNTQMTRREHLCSKKIQTATCASLWWLIHLILALCGSHSKREVPHLFILPCVNKGKGESGEIRRRVLRRSARGAAGEGVRAQLKGSPTGLTVRGMCRLFVTPSVR